MLRPIIHFFLIGTLLFGAERLWTAREVPNQPLGEIRLDAETRERLIRESVSQTGRAPSEDELAARAVFWADEEILFREARRIGLDQVDPVVRSRLIRNMRFLGGADDARDDEELYAEALELGMDESDIVVRRRLVQQMRFLLEGTAMRVDPTDEELAAYVASRPERYRIPERVRLSHIYLSRDRRRDALHADAERLLAQLRADAVPASRARALGDPFLHPSDFGLQSQRQLARQLGAEFAADVMNLEPGRWEGPIPSAYGNHLVWIHERETDHEPELETVRRSAVSSLQAERNEAAFQRELDALRERYVIDLASPGEDDS